MNQATVMTDCKEKYYSHPKALCALILRSVTSIVRTQFINNAAEKRINQPRAHMKETSGLIINTKSRQPRKSVHCAAAERQKPQHCTVQQGTYDIACYLMETGLNVDVLRK